MKKIHIEFIKSNLGNKQIETESKFRCIKCNKQVSNCYCFQKGKGSFIDTKVSTWICPYCLIEFMKSIMRSNKNAEN